MVDGGDAARELMTGDSLDVVLSIWGRKTSTRTGWSQTSGVPVLLFASW